MNSSRLRATEFEPQTHRLGRLRRKNAREVGHEDVKQTIIDSTRDVKEKTLELRKCAG